MLTENDVMLIDSDRDGNVAIVTKLLANESDPRAKAHIYEMALKVANIKGNTEIVELINEKISGNSQVEQDEEELDVFSLEDLIDAAEEGNLTEVKRLVALDPSMVTERGCAATPLHYAAQNGHIEIAKYLLEKGANVNAMIGESTPLHYACMDSIYDRYDMVNFLIKNGADVWALDYKHKTPIVVAADCEHLSTFVTLLNNGANISDEHVDKLTNMLLLASATNDECLVNELIEAGANDPFGENNDGNDTPLEEDFARRLDISPVAEEDDSIRYLKEEQYSQQILYYQQQIKEKISARNDKEEESKEYDYSYYIYR